MPQLNHETTVERFYLPSTEALPADSPDKAWVDLELGPIVPRDTIGTDLSGDNTTAAVGMLANRLRSWNYTDASGAILPINFDTVKILDMEDFYFLTQKLNKSKVTSSASLTNDEKKA